MLKPRSSYIASGTGVIAAAALCGLALSANADMKSAEQAMQQQRYGDAMAELKPLAEHGDARAQASLGTLMMYGLGMPRDDKAALETFTKLAKTNPALGDNGLAGFYVLRQPGPEGYAKALALYRKHAQEGDAMSQYGLGTMYLYGYGVPVDYVQAAYWYERSANQRNVCALSGLAYLYDAGLGVERDGARAVSLYQQALDGGMALAGYNLRERPQRASGPAASTCLVREGCRARHRLCPDPHRRHVPGWAGRPGGRCESADVVEQGR